MLPTLIGMLLAKKNRQENRTLFIPDGYISDQRRAPVCRMRYGVARMGFNGCEVLAAYHALYSLGCKLPLWQVAEDFSRRGLWLFGIFGTLPRAIPAFFRRRGFTVTRYSPRHPDDGIAQSVLIYSYWNPHFRGIHTVEFHKTPRGYVVVNYAPLMGMVFPSPGVLCDAIPAARRIQLIGIRK